MIGLLRLFTVGFIAFGMFLTTSVVHRSDFSSNSMNHDSPKYGLYRIQGRMPKGFDTFYEFELIPPVDTGQAAKSTGKIAITGAVFIRPSEFQSKVQTEARGELNVDGEFSKTNAVRLQFKSAMLVLQPASSDELEFETEPIQGIHYEFKGAFVGEFLLPGGPYISLRGKLTKFTEGNRTAESELNFVRSSHE
jgi:hypothetical protein